ncbi:hypothetical protein K8Q94_00800 [Candidatus Nomurabacteria bacterium]|nr:hypothetical protein [Candidatus Nomurabacteria bacterium]
MSHEIQKVTCQNHNISKHCQGEFTIEPDDFVFYKKIKVPPPTFCPECRTQRAMVWRNETTLYSGNKCNLCNKSVLTMYNPKSDFIIYCNSCYRGDKWEPRDYAMDYDFSKSFFEQFEDLMRKVPKNALYNTSGAGLIVDSPYNNCVGGLKNCYMCFNSANLEDCMYSRGVTRSKEVLDSYFCKKIENCYEAINTYNSVNSFWIQNSNDILDSIFLYDCANVSNCLGCVNLRNKSFCILNEQYSKEEYFSFLNKIKGSYSNLENFRNQFISLTKSLPKRANQNIKTMDCVGDYLTECKNVKHGFEVMNSEDCKRIYFGRDIKDSRGTIGYGIKSELLLECVSTGYTSRAIGCWACELSQDLEYCVSCFPSNKNLIGCDSMRNSQYCILNKQYSKEEYEKIKIHINEELTVLGVYGLMLPSEISPFSYNETLAQDNYNLSEEEVLKEGFVWEKDIQMTSGKETADINSLVDNINETSEDICKEILACIDCNRNYKITEQEFYFYKNKIIPVPRKCFYCRHQSRIVKRGSLRFDKEICNKCNIDIYTNLNPKDGDIVYCEKCYQQKVY